MTVSQDAKRSHDTNHTEPKTCEDRDDESPLTIAPAAQPYAVEINSSRRSTTVWGQTLRCGTTGNVAANRPAATPNYNFGSDPKL